MNRNENISNIILENLKESKTSGTNTLDLSTNLLELVDVDFYSRDDDFFSDVSEAMSNDMEEENIKLSDEEYNRIYDKLSDNYMEQIEDAVIGQSKYIIEDSLKKVLPSAKVKVKGMYHPPEYNYLTDDVDFTLTYSVKEYNDLLKKTINDDKFYSYIEENYSSYSGYHSFMPSNKEEFDNCKDMWRQFCEVVMYNLNTKTDFSFEENTDTLWEYVLCNTGVDNVKYYINGADNGNE